MARPMVLMQQQMLHQLHLKHIQGVPVLALIRQYKLDDDITAPTLTKLLSYAKAMVDSDTAIHELIHKSLFPKWLEASKLTVVTCPSEYYYTGKMPLGKWVKRGEEHIVVKEPIKPVTKPKAKVKQPVKKGKTNGKA
jgi:hypothetical protein